MAEGFIGGINRQLLFWSGWVFTVAGAFAGIWVGWIGILITVVGLASLTAFAYQKHQETVTAERDLGTAKTRLDEAERKLGQMPTETLFQIQQIIAVSSFNQLVEFVVRHADYVSRMVQFFEGAPALNLRTFTDQGGVLYAVARVEKLEKTTLALLRESDPFVLTRKDSGGLITDSARLVLHQKDEKSASIWFVVESYLGDEMAHLAALATKKEVAGLTGYSMRPVCAVDRYMGFDLKNAVGLIQALTDEIKKTRGFQK